MPAMIAHFLLGKRVLRCSGLPPILRKDAFLIGTQGPDMLYFHRVYPWQPGMPSFRFGNKLHQVEPSLLVDTLRELLSQTPKTEYAVVESYIQGFLCHYAADRTIHPFVKYWETWLREKEPRYARIHNPYHYRIESALDGELLAHDTGRRVEDMALVYLLPQKDAVRDRAIARLYVKLLARLFGHTCSEAAFCKAVEDFRQSLWLMTDRSGIKRTLLGAAERVTGTRALLSSLLRSRSLCDRDYANRRHAVWQDAFHTERRDDFFMLCDRTTELSETILRAFAEKRNGSDITQNIDFAGKPFKT